MKRLELGFVGFGNMASAIAQGVAGAGKTLPQSIGIYDVDRDKLGEWRARGARVFSDIPSLVRDCSTVILAVKPQVFPQVLPLVKEGVCPDTVLVSIAAGITIRSVKKAMGFDCKVIRIMPNTPLMLGEGASAVSREAPVTDEEFAFVMDIFSAAGIAREIAPDKMDEIVPVNGSSPAFFYLLAKTAADWAEKNGLCRDSAMALFCQTMTGSARMLMESGKGPQELIDMVCSPGGTTIAAMEALERGGFAAAVEAAFDDCARRSRELAGEG